MKACPRWTSRPSNHRNPAKATNHPNTPLMIDRMTLSIRSWRTIRPRPAPTAIRMEISRDRAAARDKSMLATSAQAISSTKPTANSMAMNSDLESYTPYSTRMG